MSELHHQCPNTDLLTRPFLHIPAHFLHYHNVPPHKTYKNLPIHTVIEIQDTITYQTLVLLCLTDFNFHPERERISLHQRGRGLGIKTQEEAHLFSSDVPDPRCHTAGEGGERCEGRAWVPGAWEVNCTVCPPSGDNNSQSVI